MQMATRAVAGLCLAVIVAAGPATARGEQQTRRQRADGQAAGSPGAQERRFWWKDAQVQKELGLSKYQVAKIERIWEESIPAIRAAHKEMDGLEAELNRLIRENTADEKVVALQIDRVEARRSEINKARSLMLYRMHRVLTPEQYQGLTKHLERRLKERGRR
jgi:Spy/CpxP family protein refolding chaperone